jgi:hypothetical protein
MLPFRLIVVAASVTAVPVKVINDAVAPDLVTVNQLVSLLASVFKVQRIVPDVFTRIDDIRLLAAALAEVQERAGSLDALPALSAVIAGSRPRPPVPSKLVADVAVATSDHAPSPRRNLVEFAVPVPRRAVPTVPLDKLLAFSDVREAPLPENEVPVTAPVSVIAVAATVKLAAVLPERVTFRNEVKPVKASPSNPCVYVPDESTNCVVTLLPAAASALVKVTTGALAPVPAYRPVVVPLLATVPVPAKLVAVLAGGVAHVPSPRRKVVELAVPVPRFDVATGEVSEKVVPVNVSPVPAV